MITKIVQNVPHVKPIMLEPKNRTFLLQNRKYGAINHFLLLFLHTVECTQSNLAAPAAIFHHWALPDFVVTISLRTGGEICPSKDSTNGHEGSIWRLDQGATSWRCLHVGQWQWPQVPPVLSSSGDVTVQGAQRRSRHTGQVLWLEHDEVFPQVRRYFCAIVTCFYA